MLGISPLHLLRFFYLGSFSFYERIEQLGLQLEPPELVSERVFIAERVALQADYRQGRELEDALYYRAQRETVLRAYYDRNREKCTHG